MSDFGQPRVLSATYDDKLQEIVFITHSSLGDTQLKVLTREVGPPGSKSAYYNPM